MIYDNRVYRVLLISASEKFGESLRSLLPTTSYYRMMTVRSVKEARNLMRQELFDFIVINRYPYDKEVLALAREVGQRKDCVCLLFVRKMDHDEMHARLVESGVYTVSKPLSADMLAVTFKWLEASREQMRSRGKTRVPGEAELMQVRRAKELLMRERRMTEDEAHVYISMRAMDACVSKAEIAAEILADT